MPSKPFLCQVGLIMELHHSHRSRNKVTQGMVELAEGPPQGETLQRDGSGEESNRNMEHTEARLERELVLAKLLRLLQISISNLVF